MVPFLLLMDIWVASSLVLLKIVLITIYNSQDIETPKCPLLDEWGQMDKEDVVYYMYPHIHIYTCTY